jgi:hypothetical protein
MNRPVLVTIAILEAVAILLLALELAAGPSTPANAAPAPAKTTPTTVPDEAPTAPPAADEPRTAPATELPGGTTEPLRGAMVFGKIRMAEGGALPPSVFVSLLPSGGGNALYDSTLQRPRSSFAWPLVPPGDYELRTRAEGAQPKTVPVLVPAGAPELRIDVELESSWLVRVLLLAPDGRPYHEVRKELIEQRPELRPQASGDGPQVVALWHEIPANLPTSELRSTPLTIATWRSSQGFESPRGRVGGDLPARYAGVLEMPERRPAHVAVVQKDFVLARGTLTAGQEELQLTVDPKVWIDSLATLRLQVVDEAGQPLAGAKVGLNDAQSWRQPSAAGDDGRFEQTNLAPGRLQLSVSAGDRALPPFVVLLQPGTVTDLGQLVLRPQRTVTIVVRDPPDGDGLSMSFVPLDPSPHARLEARTERLHVHKGKATANLVEGRYRLLVAGRGGARVEFDTRALGDAPLEVSLEPEATLEIDPTGADGPRRLVVRTQNGIVVLDRWITWRTRWRQQILPGTYQVTVQALQGEAKEQTLVVGADGATLAL